MDRKKTQKAKCSIERIEHDNILKYFDTEATVLELGARYGTSSCTICKRQNNSGRLVAVEPDPSAWESLQANRLNNNCNFTIIQMPVSSVPIAVQYSSAYNTISVPARKNSPYITFTELEIKLGVKFTSILIDCEGCIEFLFGNMNLQKLHSVLKHIDTILLEADMAIGHRCNKQNCVDYGKWEKRFNQAGLQTVLKIQDPIFESICHYVFKR